MGMRRKYRNGPNFYERESKINRKLLGEIGIWCFWTMTMIMIAFALVYLFGIRTSVIGGSMEPTLSNGQEILIDRFTYFFVSPETEDVIVFLPNGNSNSHYYIKRVIATPGQKIQIKEGSIYIDDLLYREATEYDKIENAGIAANPIVLGEDEYFVLGDNRNNSEDSRSSNIGIIRKEYIIGKAWFHLASQQESPGFL